MARRDPSHIVMAGTSAATRGGIASVVNAYRAAGLFARWPIEYVATHCDGTPAAKLARAGAAFIQMLGLACRHPSALLHVHSASRASFWRKSVYMALARLAGWPVLFHLHGGGFARFYEKECGPVRRAIVRFFLDRAAAIVVVSERWSEWMRTVTSNPRIVCIPNPVSMPAAAQAQRDPSLIAFVGRCEAGKGAYDLLHAVDALRDTLPGVRIEFAGDGDIEGLRRRADELGLAERVRFAGWIGAQGRDQLLARCAVFALPSHAEGLPMSLLEAMAAGCPVIAGAVGGIPDLVAHGASGLLVPPGDRESLALALERVLLDRGLAARLGAEARATIAQRYTPEQTLERLEQIYGNLGVSREPVRAHASSQRLQEIS